MTVAARVSERVSSAGSIAVRPLLSGERQELRVVATFPAAVYLAVPDTGEVMLALVARDGVAHPNALVVSPAIADAPFAAARDGQTVVVGGGRAAAPWADIEVARWWSPTPSLPPLAPALLHRGVRAASAALTGGPELRAGEQERFAVLTAALAAADGRAADHAALTLLGLGAGLTPTGDDLLAGVLAGLALLGPAVDGAPPAVVKTAAATGEYIAERASGRTTAISAALLRHAVRGELCQPVGRLLLALCDPDRPGAVEQALGRLLAVGATSGRDLALGLLAAADLAAGPQDGADRPAALDARQEPDHPAATVPFSPRTRRP